MNQHVNENLAHLQRDREAGSLGVTFGDVHEAVAVIYAVYHRWYQVITDTSLAPLQPPKWEHIFTIPWIDPPIAVEIADHRDREWQELMTELGLGSP